MSLNTLVFKDSGSNTGAENSSPLFRFNQQNQRIGLLTKVPAHSIFLLSFVISPLESWAEDLQRK